MCIDFTELNKACPKDNFPLPQIDMLVDSTVGHGLLSFMNAFSGYNQIRMHPADQEKTAFITDPRVILLPSHAIWVEECRRDVPKIDEQDVSKAYWKKYGGLYRRYSC
jgi:hypothetical protein